MSLFKFKSRWIKSSSFSKLTFFSLFILIQINHPVFTFNLPKVSINRIINEDLWDWKNVEDIVEEDRLDNFKTIEKGFVISNLFGVEIVCKAPYPIYWKVDKPEDLGSVLAHDIYTFTSRNGSIDDTPPKDWSYTAILQLIYLNKDFTHNYTCRSMDNDLLETSVYLFVEGNLPTVFLRAGETFNISMDGNSIIEAPCGLEIFDKDIQVILLKEDTELSNKTFKELKWNPIPQNLSITYEPRKGFSFIVQDLQSLPGNYKCIINIEDEDDVVYFTIRKDFNSNLIEPFNWTPRNSLQGTAAVWPVSDHGYLDYICCSSTSDKPPQMKAISCNSPAECEIKKKIVLNNKLVDPYLNSMSNYYYSKHGLSKNCTVAWLESANFFVMCKGEGIDVFQQYYYSFKEKYEKDSKYLREMHPRITFEEIDLNPISSLSANPIKYDDFIKIYHFKSRQITTQSGIVYNIPDYRGGRIDDDFMYSGVNVTFKCFSSPYIFAVGGYWIIKWKNGDTRKVSDETSNRNNFFLDDNGIISLIIELEPDMVSVTCNSPVLNSMEWKSKERKFNVKAPAIPLLDKPQQEEIYWTLNDANVELECKFSGSPAPTVYWKKDDKILSVHDQNSFVNLTQHNDTAILQIWEVSHETHGEYNCILENLGGKSIKTFLVFVDEKSSMLGLFITFFLLALVSIIGGVYWKTAALSRIKRLIFSNATPSVQDINSGNV